MRAKAAAPLDRSSIDGIGSDVGTGKLVKDILSRPI
jgi:hypothetical protein